MCLLLCSCNLWHHHMPSDPLAPSFSSVIVSIWRAFGCIVGVDIVLCHNLPLWHCRRSNGFELVHTACDWSYDPPPRPHPQQIGVITHFQSTHGHAHTMPPYVVLPSLRNRCNPHSCTATQSCCMATVSRWGVHAKNTPLSNVAGKTLLEPPVFSKDNDRRLSTTNS